MTRNISSISNADLDELLDGALHTSANPDTDPMVAALFNERTRRIELAQHRRVKLTRGQINAVSRSLNEGGSFSPSHGDDTTDALSLRIKWGRSYLEAHPRDLDLLADLVGGEEYAAAVEDHSSSLAESCPAALLDHVVALQLLAANQAATALRSA